MSFIDDLRTALRAPDATWQLPDHLPADIEILRTLTNHHRLQTGGKLFPCAGVYAIVETPGTMHVGDHVVVN